MKHTHSMPLTGNQGSGLKSRPAEDETKSQNSLKNIGYKSEIDYWVADLPTVGVSELQLPESLNEIKVKNIDPLSQSQAALLSKKGKNKKQGKKPPASEQS